MHLMRTFPVKLLLALIIIAPLAGTATAADRPSPPTQPAQGPGGAERPYPNVQSDSYGERPTGYWLFEPLDASGNPRKEAVVLKIEDGKYKFRARVKPAREA